MKNITHWIVAILAFSLGPLPEAIAQQTQTAARDSATDKGPILPDSSEGVREALVEVHRKHRSLREGKVADHTEVSAQADPDLFAIVLVTTEGQIFQVGDADAIFPLQSLSKAFAFGVALEDRGEEVLLARVGVHATGLPYGSLLATEVRATRLQNPMVSAGAIATTSLIGGDSEQERWQRVHSAFSTFAGTPLSVLEDVYESEMAGNQASLSKAHVLAGYDLLEGDPEEVVRRYLRACSLGVTTVQLAQMAATLANDGKHPTTGKRVLTPRNARGVLSAMTVAGMYDDSGPWLYRIGLPAKSGVAGGVIAVVPNRFAIAVYSPPLDSFGNSVRAGAVLRDLSERWSLHILE
jgi:glutaminase